MAAPLREGAIELSGRIDISAQKRTESTAQRSARRRAAAAAAAIACILGGRCVRREAGTHQPPER
eukprot:SAG11_NODE_11491_length_757_cov_0.939210_1_plen_64_part_10